MGFLPGLGGVLPNNFQLVFVGDNEGSGTTINIGASGSIAAGDICLIHNVGRTVGSVPASVTPSGFTLLRSAGSLELRMNLSAKILSGSETTVTGISAGSWETWGVLVVRPSHPVSSWLDNDTGNNDISSSDPAGQTITVSTGTAPILAFAVFGNRGSPSLSTASMTSFASPTNVFGDSQAAYFKIFNPGDNLSNISVDMSDGGGANAMQSGWLSFTP